jgi:hypothetical protein
MNMILFMAEKLPIDNIVKMHEGLLKELSSVHSLQNKKSFQFIKWEQDF